MNSPKKQVWAAIFREFFMSPSRDLAAQAVRSTNQLR
jgi:hypothetical protein